MNRPQEQEYPASYKNYMEVAADDVIKHLDKQAGEIAVFFQGLSAKENFAYAPGKWTIKEVLGHLTDTERVMSYRLMCIARGEQKDLPGFDENTYVSGAGFDEKKLDSLCEEFSLLRKSNLLLIKSLSDTELKRKGLANGSPISVRALVYMLAGHAQHHLQVVKERYL